MFRGLTIERGGLEKNTFNAQNIFLPTFNQPLRNIRYPYILLLNSGKGKKLGKENGLGANIRGGSFDGIAGGRWSWL